MIRPHSWWHEDEVTVHAIRTKVKLHSQLPKTTVWAYDGQFPGPTVEVRSGKRLRVYWTNGIDGTLPLIAVQAPLDLTGPPENDPTTTPGYRNPDGSLPAGVKIVDGVDQVPAWTVTHLHGADTNGGNDGWAHNAVLRGHSQLTEYPNGQRATALWYHDHAMAITRFNVHTGLAGMYLVRDEEEDKLGLPDGEHEVPLIITDRNLDTDLDGNLTGNLLYKFPYVNLGEEVPVPFSGPFTLVNGVIWPHLDVEARWYRFRVVNTSNSRIRRLNLFGATADGSTDTSVDLNHLVRQIGTDGGLLPAPAELPDGGLVLAPAERADLLINFGAEGYRGRRLRLRDTRVPLNSVTGQPVIEPDVMEFRVEDRTRRDPFVLPEKLATSYVRLQHGTTVPEDHDHVFLALVPPGTAGEGHPQMWELREITDPGQVPPPSELPREGLVQVADPDTGKTRTFERVAAMFDDTVSIFLKQNKFAVWNILHLAAIPPEHPIHIHLVQFQALFRRSFPSTFDPAKGGTTTPVTNFTNVPLEKYEEGWKDTILVNPGEWVSVAAKFGDSTGEFMYHCHILDHEDEGMMRPFVVQPPAVAPFHHHPGGDHHGH
jgi:FtsP/CotA-like multicopper oxidase with cupredoxin domain